MKSENMDDVKVSSTLMLHIFSSTLHKSRREAKLSCLTESL